jgi:CheY-like chemotaxis protein
MPKVLVVDDSVSVRKVVEKALESRSVEVLSAASGREAIERIERDRPDLVVCDVILPDKDGYQICEFVRTHPVIGRTPVLLISGVVNSTVLARAAEVQSNDVMFKPFAAEELVRKIDGLLSPRANGTHAAGEPDAPASPPVAGLKARLAALGASSGVRFAALADREGFLIEAAGDLDAELEVAGALAACLAESSDGIGRELKQGALQGIILEYERGLLLLHGVGPAALLAVAVSDATALGKVRYFVKKAIPELEQAL